MEHSWNHKGKEPQGMAVTRIKSGHAKIIACYATPNGMEKRQRRETGNVEYKSRGVVGSNVYGGLILHSLKNAKGNACDKAEIDHSLCKHRLTAATLKDEEWYHLCKLFGKSHAKHIANDAKWECRISEDIEEIEIMQRAKYEKHTGLRKEESRYSCLGVYLTRAEQPCEKKAPNGGKV